MRSVFNYTNYRDFLKASLKERGLKVGQVAKALSVQTSFISQVLHRGKHFSLEQAHRFTQFLGLEDYEIEFFLTLVEKERAGSKSLKSFLDKRLKRIRDEQSARIRSQGLALSKEELGVFYSSWQYSAVRLLSSIPKFQTVESISQALELPLSQVESIVEFLVSVGLCTIEGENINIGVRQTFTRDRTYANRHHLNWRMKALERLNLSRVSKDFSYTLPMTLSRADADRVAKLLQESVEKIQKMIAPSSPEVLAGFNLDWFVLRD